MSTIEKNKIKKSFDPNDFKNSELSKKILTRLPNGRVKDKYMEKYKFHREIKMTFCQNFALYLENYFHNFGWGILYCGWCGCTRKKSTMQKIFEIGEDRIDMELDMIKIVRNLKNMRIFMKHQVQDDTQMLKLIHDD